VPRSARILLIPVGTNAYLKTPAPPRAGSMYNRKKHLSFASALPRCWLS
jgi:hypothetical protein